MRKFRGIFVIVFASVSSMCAAQQNGKLTQETAALLNELDGRLKSNAAKENVGSIAAAVIDGDAVIWTGSYGFIDKDKKTAPSSNSLYLIGSVSKSVTGLALAKLVESGVIKLDDPVNKYVPEISTIKDLPQHTILNIRQLATHTSGLSRDSDLPTASEGPITSWEEKLLLCLPMTTYLPASYQQYAYSNIGYGILGLVMCRATGKKFDALLDELVFKPLKMKNTALTLTPEMQKNLAIGYPGTRDYNLGRGYKFPNGGVYSTLDDMVNFTKAQLHTDFENFLSQARWKEVQGFQTVIKESNDEKYGYGLGVSEWTDKKNKLWVYHNGTVAPGYSTSVYCDLNSKLAIVILRNDSGTDEIAGIADEFLYRLGEVKK